MTQLIVSSGCKAWYVATHDSLVVGQVVVVGVVVRYVVVFLLKSINRNLVITSGLVCCLLYHTTTSKSILNRSIKYYHERGR